MAINKSNKHETLGLMYQTDITILKNIFLNVFLLLSSARQLCNNETFSHQ